MTLPETNRLPLNIVIGRLLSFWVSAYFQGLLLVLGWVCLKTYMLDALTLLRDASLQKFVNKNQALKC